MLFSLKGAVLVDAIKAEVVRSEMQQFQASVGRFLTDYKELPGDSVAAERMWGREQSLSRTPSGQLAAMVNNGRIEGTFYDTGNAGGEQYNAWRDLRFAGMVTGDAALQGSSAMPENPFGGFYGFDEGNLGQKSGSICTSRIPGRSALQIDSRIDDGGINTGRMVATSKFSIEQNNHFEAPDSEPYNVEKEYIICVPLLP